MINRCTNVFKYRPTLPTRLHVACRTLLLCTTGNCLLVLPKQLTRDTQETKERERTQETEETQETEGTQETQEAQETHKRDM